MGRELLFAFVLIAFTASITADEVRRYDGYQVLSLVPKTKAQLKFLHDLEATTLEYNFWTFPRALNESVDVMVPPNRIKQFRKQLRKLNIQYETTIKDAEQAFKRQREEVVRVNTNDPSVTQFTAYQRLATVFSFLENLRASNPSITQIETIGRSSGNRELRLLKIGTNLSGSTKPIIFIDGGIHAREWISPATAQYLANQLVTGYASGNADARQLVEAFDWYILPVLNPDGYEYTHTNDRLWRKTRSSNSGSTCVGTDPNRNYDYYWNHVGASTNPCSEIFAGSRGFSESETKAHSDYIYALRNRIKGYFNIHSYGQYWIFPYGWTSALPPDNTELTNAARNATNALTALYNTRYTIGTSTNVLYAAAGGADDWAYGVAGITYSYCVELRDTGSYGFTLPTSQIVATGTETTAGFYSIARYIGTKLRLFE